MKSKLLLLLALTSATLLQAEKNTGGPKGGRLLESMPLQAEFFVNADRKVEITFYDAGLKPVAPGTQTVTVTAEPATGRTPVELEKTDTGFVSKSGLPAGEPYRIVVQVRATADAKPQNFRIDLNMGPCGECKRAEYACICEGH